MVSDFLSSVLEIQGTDVTVYMYFRNKILGYQTLDFVSHIWSLVTNTTHTPLYDIRFFLFGVGSSG